jgi:hypothetical protein
MDDQQREVVEYDFSCAASTYNDCVSEAVWELRRAANVIDGYSMPLIDDETSKGSEHIAQLYARSIDSIKALESRVNAAMATLVSQTHVVNEDCATFVKMMADDETQAAREKSENETMAQYISTIDGLFNALHGDNDSRAELLESVRTMLAEYIPDEQLNSL